MIVGMKRVALIAPESQRDEFLTELRKLGVVHIKHVSPPSSGSISSVEEQISTMNKAIAILEGCRIPQAAGKVIWEPSQISEKAKEITAIAAEREDLTKSQIYLKNRLEQFKPWGSFDPKDLKAFANKDISVRLYRMTKGALKKASKEDNAIQIINEDKQYVYIAQVCKTDDEYLQFEEIRFPDESFEEIYNKHESFKKRIEEIESDLRASARAQKSLKEYLKILENKKVFLNVANGMGREKGFSYLRGYCPADRVKRLTEFARNKELGCLVEDTSDSEDVPTLIRNPKWIDIISPVFKFMNTVPGYSEFDISLPFLIFFSLFFAMLIGDAGYGFLFLVGTYLARRKLRSAPIQPFALMYVLSTATIAWGAVSGVWFGSEEISKLPFINALIIRRVNGFVADNQEFIIYLCFIIGAIHLVIAHLIRAFRTINNLVALSEIGWALTLCGLFFTSGTLVIGRPFPEFAKYLLISGAALIMLFTYPQKNVLKGVLAALGTVPLKILSSFADVVSYIRLFAVGYASVAVAGGFNEMAMMLGFNSIITGLCAAIILVLGHTINIILGVMSVVVHGIRLNMLEFSGQLGMEWTGREYDPFREAVVK